jgi:hypothetical protein
MFQSGYIGMNGEDQQQNGCACLTSPTSALIISHEFGMDSRFGEVTLWICPLCGQFWLRYFYENEGFSGSGRWYLGAIQPEQAAVVTAEDAREVLEALEWYFYGGSYYGGLRGRTSGKLFL